MSAEHAQNTSHLCISTNKFRTQTETPAKVRAETGTGTQGTDTGRLRVATTWHILCPRWRTSWGCLYAFLAVGQNYVLKKWNPGKRKHGLDVAVPWWFDFDPFPYIYIYIIYMHIM